MAAELVEITRSYIRLLLDDRTIRIDGEAYLPGHGSPDFVAYISSIKEWESPHADQVLDEHTIQSIIETIKNLFKQKNMTIEFE